MYSISLPKPKRLRISESFHCFLSECNFVIDAPNLESVYLKQDHGLTYYVENAKFLVKASIINEGRSSYIGPKPYFKLLKGICTVKYLFLDWACLFKVSIASLLFFYTMFGRYDTRFEKWDG